MIFTMLRMSVTSLRRDVVVLGLTFGLPIAFFTIFALIFGGAGGRSQTPTVAVAVADEDQSETSRRLVEALGSDTSLDVRTTVSKKSTALQTRATALQAVKSGDLSVAVIVPKGFGASFPDFTGTGPAIEVLVDPADPVAPQMVAGLLQKAAMTAAPDLMIRRGLETLEQFGGLMTDRQRELIDEFSAMMRKDKETPASRAAGSKAAVADAAAFGLVRTKMVEVVGAEAEEQQGSDENKMTRKSLVAYQAAATAVMFLLFMATGAGGALLDEQESGTLERLLSSHLRMPTLLAGKWLFVTLLGMLQVTVMFLWGAAFFHLQLFTARNLTGFVIMTAATAGAAAAFGLVLATLCRSRGQLSGISTIVILMMSALGGSMIPRFVMSETMQKIGYATFNAWALDGYRKVFWFQSTPLQQLWPQVLVLLGATVVFLIAARVLARRWEVA